MKKIKSVIALTLAALTCGTFAFAAGCNSNPPSTEITGELEFDENNNVIFEDVNIKLATVVAGSDKAVFDQLVARFNVAYEGKIYIESDSTSQGIYETQIANRISKNNNPPDLLMSHGKYHKNFADKGLIQPFNNVMTLSGIEINFSDYSEGLMKYNNLGATDGSVYSIAADAQSTIVVYNKQLMKSIGYTEAPSNRAELLDACAKYKAQYNKTPIAWADADNSTGNFQEYTLGTAILQNGGSIANAEGRCDWHDNETNRAAVQNAINAYRELYDNGYAVRNYAKNNCISDFVNGNSLFYFLAPWELSGLVINYAEKNNITEQQAIADYVGGASLGGWFAMGDNANRAYANYIYGDSHCFAMSRTVTDITKQAAILEFINWFTTSGTVAAKWAQAGHISSCISATASSEYKSNAYASNYFANFYPDINNFQNMPVVKDAKTYVDNIVRLFSSTVLVASGYSDATDLKAISIAQADINNSLDFFN
jgi:maltose-binding protein MalE